MEKFRLLVAIISGLTMVVWVLDVCPFLGKYRAEGVDFASSLVRHARKVQLNSVDSAKIVYWPLLVYLNKTEAGNFSSLELTNLSLEPHVVYFSVDSHCVWIISALFCFSMVESLIFFYVSARPNNGVYYTISLDMIACLFTEVVVQVVCPPVPSMKKNNGSLFGQCAG
jgi:hypothetical protein